MLFYPVIYEHAAKLINKSPYEVSRNCDLMVQAHLKAYRTYHHSPVVVGVDIYNLEAEAYGALVAPPAGTATPSIINFPQSSVNDLINMKPLQPAEDGRLPMIIEAGKRLKEELPEVDIRIPVSGPFSIAGNLIGLENLIIAAVTVPEDLSKALDFLMTGQLNFCQEILKNGLQISFFESAATPPLISPELFKHILLPTLKHLFQKIGDTSHQLPALILGGDTTPILDSILETGTNYVICPAETTQNLFMEKMRKYPGVKVRINLKSNVLISNRREIIVQEVDRVLALTKNRRNVCIGTGILAYDTNPNLILKIEDYVHNSRS